MAINKQREAAYVVIGMVADLRMELLASNRAMQKALKKGDITANINNHHITNVMALLEDALNGLGEHREAHVSQ
jgi:hypothetical protein